MRYAAVIEKGPESYGAYVPDLPGCGVVSESRDEAVRLIQEAVALHIKGLREDGQPIPPPSSTIAFINVAA